MPGKSVGGHQWLDSCGQYNTIIPSVHYPTTVIVITEEPTIPIDIVYQRILCQRMRVFTRRMPSRISQLPEADLTAQQLHSFKWTVRVIDLCITDSLFFITKKFSHSDTPCDLPICERHDILKSEPWIQSGSVDTHSVRCAGCTRKIEFEHMSSVLEWVAHRDICQGIEHRMMQAMFVDWADATEEEDADPPFDTPYRSVRHSFEYPLRYVRLPEYALEEVDDEDHEDYFADGASSGSSEDLHWDSVDDDDDEDDEDYFADDTSSGSSEDLQWDSDEGSSASSSLVQKAGLEQLFYAQEEESREESFALADTLKRAAQADLDVSICPTDCFSLKDEGEFITLDASETPYDEEDDTAWESSSTTPDDDEDYRSLDDGSSSSSLYLDHDEDGFPRWYSAEAYHPGYYDVSDDEDEDEEDEEEVRYISYEEHLRLWAEKHPELALAQIGACSDDSDAALEKAP